MRHTQFIQRMLAVAILSLLVTACAPAINLGYAGLPPSDTNHGHATIGTIKNLRLPHKGGDSFTNLGNVRGGFGNPFDLATPPNRPIDVALRDLMQSALANAGYPAPSQEALTPRKIDVDGLEFLCDGYGGYKVSASIVIRVVDTQSGKLLLEKNLQATDGFVQGIGYGNMQEAFNRLIKTLGVNVAEYMKSPEFRLAVGGSPTVSS